MAYRLAFSKQISGWPPGFRFCSEEFMRAATPFRRLFDFEFIREE